MAQKLQLKQSQSLVMTPQLQQAIKLLQLTNIELAEFVEEQLESNPLLERGTGTENRRDEAEAGRHGDSDFETVSFDVPAASTAELDAPAHAMDSEAAPGDQMTSAASTGGEIDWSKAGSGGSFSGSADYDAAANKAAEKNLSDVLTEQLILAIEDEHERLIGQHLIDHVDENGYLRTDLELVAENLGVSYSRVSALLGRLQGFEPTGVFARSLQECLALQLAEMGELDESMQVLLDNLDVLAKHDLVRLKKICGLSADELSGYIARIKTLSPKPGLAYGRDMAAAIEPDVFVKETPQGGWTVELNTGTLPRVLVDNRYYNEICSTHSDDATKSFMTECHQNASWLVKSLDQRARTILKVATEIVKQQDGFFAYGIDHMRPLNLRTVAEAIEMHESTVSRVTSNKFISTPRGVFELKYFFTTAIASMDSSEGHSAEAVRHKIKILVSEETAKTVKSDDNHPMWGVLEYALELVTQPSALCSP